MTSEVDLRSRKTGNNMICAQDIIRKMLTGEPVNKYYNDLNEPWNVIQSVIDVLPNVLKDDIDWTEIEIATNGDVFLLRYGADCERFADALDEHVFGSKECHTGYYDPFEDAQGGETDELTGWYYIDWD